MKAFSIICAFAAIACLVILFVGAYGRVLAPARPFEFYFLTAMLLVVSGMLSALAAAAIELGRE